MTLDTLDSDITLISYSNQPAPQASLEKPPIDLPLPIPKGFP